MLLPWLQQPFQRDITRRLDGLAPDGASRAWSVARDEVTRTLVKLGVVYDIEFGVGIADAQPRGLPAGVVPVASSAELDDALRQQRAAHEKALAQRLEAWSAKHASGPLVKLSPDVCLGPVQKHGYQFLCEGCPGPGCAACAGLGVRHVIGKVTCKINRSHSISVPGDPEAHPRLRESCRLEELLGLGLFGQGRAKVEPGRLYVRYEGAITTRGCQVKVHNETLQAWAYGKRRERQDYAFAAQKLHEPWTDALGRTLQRPEERAAHGKALRRCRTSPLYERAVKESPARDEELKALVRDRLVKPEYLDLIHGRGPIAKTVRRNDLIRFWAPIVAVAVLLGSFVGVVTWRWTMAKQVLHAAGLPDWFSGVYENGDERVLVVASGGRQSLVRHVKTAQRGYCDERGQLELGLAGEYTLANVPYLRSRGAALTLLPRAQGRCIAHREPIVLQPTAKLVRCLVVAEQARPTRVDGFATPTLVRGADVEVAPWHADLHQVLVRARDGLGVLPARDIECDEVALRALRDALFGASRRRLPMSAAR